MSELSESWPIQVSLLEPSRNEATWQISSAQHCQCFLEKLETRIAASGQLTLQFTTTIRSTLSWTWVPAVLVLSDKVPMLQHRKLTPANKTLRSPGHQTSSVGDVCD